VGSSSVYEQWVLGLRAWRSDPSTDLSHLPALDETSFPPATYDRLIDHLNEAINAFMAAWNDQLLGAVRSATDTHALARALVDARRGLAHRLVLARHPSLPETIRRQLLTQAEADIRGLQRQLEERAEHVAESASSLGRTEREAALRLHRENSLTAVLDPAFSLDGVDDREVARADAIEQHGAAAVDATPFTTARPQRRVFIAPTEG
jgi:hypothetical protein